MDGINQLPEGKKQFEQKVMRRVWTENRGAVKQDMKNVINIKSIKLIGTETVKTEAGSFMCYKLYVDTDQELGVDRKGGGFRGKSISMPGKWWMYFNKELGVVKLDAAGGYIELSSIRK